MSKNVQVFPTDSPERWSAGAHALPVAASLPQIGNAEQKPNKYCMQEQNEAFPSEQLSLDSQFNHFLIVLTATKRPSATSSLCLTDATVAGSGGKSEALVAIGVDKNAFISPSSKELTAELGPE